MRDCFYQFLSAEAILDGNDGSLTHSEEVPPMRSFLQFCLLVTKPLVGQACAALSVPGGEAVGDKVASFLA